VSTDSISNFIKIDDKIGTAGQPTVDQLQAARDEGYEAIINLAPSNPENHGLRDEPAVVASLGMTYHYIPIEWTNPRQDRFVAFTEVMNQLRGRKVLIHCAANFRVTAFFSLYAMKHEGWTAEQADRLIAKVWESRSDYRMDDTWRSFIAEIRAQIFAQQSG
jgi:protein tyrosine phosphatase (PTP) superfamily phosphohydrolase (DUF442 family)